VSPTRVNAGIATRHDDDVDRCDVADAVEGANHVEGCETG
jgi:hypothetical protein